MKNSDLADKIKRLLQRETRYKADAYEFVNAAVNYAATLENSNEKQHIAALERLAGVRDFAFRQYGPFAVEVLKSWGLNTASDIGNIVFMLIDEKVLFAGENDSPDDARRLVKLLRGLKAKVNLLPLNEAAGIEFKRPSEAVVDRFAKILADADVTVSVRKSRGRDIRAACGQLATDR